MYSSNHSSVWGSYWSNGEWGYKCCHSLVKNSYCTGEAGKVHSSTNAVPSTSGFVKAEEKVQPPPSSPSSSSSSSSSSSDSSSSSSDVSFSFVFCEMMFSSIFEDSLPFFSRKEIKRVKRRKKRKNLEGRATIPTKRALIRRN